MGQEDGSMWPVDNHRYQEGQASGATTGYAVARRKCKYSEILCDGRDAWEKDERGGEPPCVEFYNLKTGEYCPY